MQALGIVRKIDELGRIVIPIEVRRTNNWPVGTPMEIMATEEGIFLKKYPTPSEDISDIVKNLRKGLEGNVSKATLLKAIELLEKNK